MKEYNKEKLNEYAKELFALCLEKGLYFDYHPKSFSVYTYSSINKLKDIGECYISESLFSFNSHTATPIWELIEKVKQL